MKEVSHDLFLDLTKPSWEDGDIMSCLKRAHVIVIGRNACYVRLAGVSCESGAMGASIDL
eukprot:6210719-Amphidinium_carterae.1